MKKLLLLALALSLSACGKAEETDCEDCDPKDEGKGGCPLVPAGGVCAGIFTLARCARADDGFEVVEERCEAGTMCGVGAEGASCRPFSDTCTGEGNSICVAGGMMRRCEGGKWVESACEHGCVDRPTGGSCRELSPGLVLHRGKVYYEHHHPAEDLRGWRKEVAPAAGLTVYSTRDDSILDIVTVAEDGSFEVLIGAEASAQEGLTFATIHTLMGEGSAAALVSVPEVEGAGPHYPDHTVDSKPWTFTFKNVRAGEFLIRESEGGGAVQVFQAMRRTVEHVASLRGPVLPGLRAFYLHGADFICGSCFIWADSPVGNVFISGGALPAHRSDAILYHEAAHYAFPLLGGEESERGMHCFGSLTSPGLAFTEGWAHWYSSDRRRDGRHVVEQRGTIFHWDLDTLDPAEAFAPPVPAGGQTQLINESWLGAALWHLAKRKGDGLFLHLAPSAPEMHAPLRSGYVAKSWTEVDERCRPLDPQDEGPETPILSDFLDALVCNGFPPEPIQEIVSPHYPFDPSEPHCK